MKEKDKILGRWFSIIHRLGQSYLDRELKAYNIGSGQVMFLVVLLKEDGISQECLSALLHIDKGTTARAVKRLVEEGYVVKRTDPADKRANILMVTQKSRDLCPLLKKIAENWADILTKDFSKEEAEWAITILKRMANNATNYA